MVSGGRPAVLPSEIPQMSLRHIWGSGVSATRLIGRTQTSTQGRGFSPSLNSETSPLPSEFEAGFQPTTEPLARHTFHCCTLMSCGYHNRKDTIAANIGDLLLRLHSSTYEEIAPKAEYWIKYAITEGWFTTPQDLAERVSSIAWKFSGPDSDCGRFLKEFRDAPRHSERVKSFVDELCNHTLLWFAAASADLIANGHYSSNSTVPSGGGNGFVNAGAFLGHLSKHGLLHRDLVRKHLVKPLTTYTKVNPRLDTVFRVNAIYCMFVNAGNALLQGLLEPRDVQACFEILDAQPITSWDRNGGTPQTAGIIKVAKLKVRFDSILDFSLQTDPDARSRNFTRSMLRGCSAERRKNRRTQQLLKPPQEK